MSEKKINIAIIGAAGFVGMELVKKMHLNEKYRLYAVTRGNNGSFILEGKNIEILSDESEFKRVKFDVIINLAYPTAGLPHYYPNANKKILDTIKLLTSSGTKIIHVSSLAVFGFGLDIDIKCEAIPNRRDYPYAEAKLQMENLIKDNFPKNEVSIVRLGNVWGVGSATWTSAMCDKLLYGQFVGVEGKDGFSNATDVKNVVSYLDFLSTRKADKKFNVYHLAEFSSIKWSEIIRRISLRLKVEPVYSDVEPSYKLYLKNDLSTLFKVPTVRQKYSELYLERYMGSYVRSTVRSLVKILKIDADKAKGVAAKPLPKTANLTGEENTFLTVVTAQQEFKLNVANGWSPAVSFEDSWEDVARWMVEVGYLN
ncbi:MAG: NAD(P)-dependent oxidoreductase [Flavobacterium sp.]|nr:MAG: NAD(P)-dependent oxidoreductase [Flavobacterium sp.]